jgi:hypothetical protein
MLLSSVSVLSTPEQKVTNIQVGFFGLPAISEYYAAIYPAFIAGFFKLYEVEPIDDKEIKLPQSKFAPGMALPVKDIRVRIRRRRDMDQPKVIST